MTNDGFVKCTCGQELRNKISQIILTLILLKVKSSTKI